jgi:hypothetical protein
MNLKEIKSNFEKEIQNEPKSAFDKLSDFLELEKSDEVYRNKFLELLNDVIEEHLNEELCFQGELNRNTK